MAVVDVVVDAVLEEEGGGANASVVEARRRMVVRVFMVAVVLVNVRQFCSRIV